MSLSISNVLELIQDEVCQPVTLETRIEDLGLDSLDFIELLQTIETKFKKIPDEMVAKLNTVGDIVNAISG